LLFESRDILKLIGGIDPGKPKFVHPKANKFIKARIANGQTNLDLMKDGKAPIGPDGKQINLHHLLGVEPGPIAELEATIHSVNHKVLHDMIEESFRRDKTLKNAYTSFRGRYWKGRAKDF
ncbi:HNH/ENDO VII family nuclease, partial [Marinagarivorans algicola]|uniref:HNH/ENDO VII family nuclease n=1 Tax=Marinagarivorans algicola TaxID=1513270 RepID=UPI00192E7408